MQARDEVLAANALVRGLPDIPHRRTGDIFQFEELGLEWDIGLIVTEPEDPSQRVRGRDARNTGFLLLNGGNGDSKSVRTLGWVLAGT